MRLPFSRRLVRRSFGLGRPLDERHLFGVFPQAVRAEFPRGNTVEIEPGEVALESGSFSAVVEVAIEGERVRSSYRIDGARFLMQSLIVALLFAAVGASWAADDGAESAFIVRFALVLFAVAMLWVGYGNLFLSYWGVARRLDRSVRAAVHMASPLPTG